MELASGLDSLDVSNRFDPYLTWFDPQEGVLSHLAVHCAASSLHPLGFEVLLLDKPRIATCKPLMAITNCH